MPIIQQNDLNTTSLVVPDLYVQISKPQGLTLNGAPTDILGIVGTASWGPVNQPVIIGSLTDFTAAFGPVLPRKYDLGTGIATASLQGAGNFRCVRVSDGTDTAAFAEAGSLGIKLTALYTGSAGNKLYAFLSLSAKADSWQLTVGMSGKAPEIFTDISGPTAEELQQNLILAINIGQNALRGPSLSVKASSLSTETLSLPDRATPLSLSFTGGSDGVEGVTGETLLGRNISPVSGLYVLRNTGCSVAFLADCDDPDTWTEQAAFGLDQGIYMILTGPASQTVEEAVSLKQQTGLYSTAAKLLFGDWLWWNDQSNQQVRLVSPQGFAAGLLVSLSPEQSGLNKPLYGIIGSQKSGQPGSAQSGTYSNADLAALFTVGIDLICTPQPGGFYWGLHLGHNTSSDPQVNGDNYTRLTDYIAASLAAGMGSYVGRLINTDLFQQVKATLSAFLNNMLSQGLLASVNGKPPFQVVCDLSNNPLSRTSLGYLEADVQVRYQAVAEKFTVNLQGGQGVSVTRASGHVS